MTSDTASGFIAGTRLWQQTTFIYLPQQTQAVPAGTLRLYEQGTRPLNSQFVYGNRYLQRSNAVAVDPAGLSLQQAKAHKEYRFESGTGLALFGAIRDAAPDAWGRRVIENRLRAPPNSLPESIYLSQAGSNRTGALDFRDKPESAEKPGLLPEAKDLQYLLDAAARVEQGETVPHNLQLLLNVGSSFGGARPKAVLLHEARQWMAKFPSHGDGFNVPLIEYATLALARACGLRVPPTRFMPLADGRDVMLIERFDRHALPRGDYARSHVVSALSMLQLHESDTHRAQYADLAHIIDLFGAKGFVAEDRRELFGRMVFNILVGNDDDHLRNHAFIWDEASHGWRLSPLYDVVPKPQLATERFLVLGIGKQGRLATLDNAFSGAAAFGILPPDATAIIGKLAAIVREWRNYFEQFGVPAGECDKVAAAFRKPGEIGLARAGV